MASTMQAISFFSYNAHEPVAESKVLSAPQQPITVVTAPEVPSLETAVLEEITEPVAETIVPDSSEPLIAIVTEPEVPQIGLSVETATLETTTEPSILAVEPLPTSTLPSIMLQQALRQIDEDLDRTDDRDVEILLKEKRADIVALLNVRGETEDYADVPALLRHKNTTNHTPIIVAASIALTAGSIALLFASFNYDEKLFEMPTQKRLQENLANLKEIFASVKNVHKEEMKAIDQAEAAVADAEKALQQDPPTAREKAENALRLANQAREEAERPSKELVVTEKMLKTARENIVTARKASNNNNAPYGPAEPAAS
ncbi:unnamed protein product [Sphagnum tenellum]